jgi:iron complex transport system substrate-binding protein
MSMTRRRLLGAAAAASFAAPAIAQSPRIVDVLGREVRLTAPPRRVVTMFNYEEFTAIAGVEGWRRVVGMNRFVWEGWRPAIFSRYSAVIPNLGGQPDVGSTDEGTFSAEKVIALRPDLLIVPQWSWASMETARAQIEAAGIAILVIDYNAQIVERHVASTLAIGAAMGTPERAAALAERYRRNMGDIQTRVARVNTGAKPKVHFELGQAGAEIIGNSYAGTMWGKLATDIGAQNIAEGKLPGPWGPLAAETTLAANPDFIFIAGSSWVNRPNAVKTGYDVAPEETRRSLAPYAARPLWQNLAAIRRGEIHAIEHGLCRTLFDDTAALYIAKRIWPGAFEGMDPVAVFADYHAKYLPVAFSGTWMLPWRA